MAIDPLSLATTALTAYDRLGTSMINAGISDGTVNPDEYTQYLVTKPTSLLDIGYGTRSRENFNKGLDLVRDANSSFDFTGLSNASLLNNESLDNLLLNYSTAEYNDNWKGGSDIMGLARIRQKELNNEIAKKNQQILNNYQSSLSDAFANNAVKQANFMLSQYAEGGNLNTNGTSWNTGTIFINNGNTHEKNPYEGVPIGIAQDGTQDLVEEGEQIVKLNSGDEWVISNRIKPSLKELQDAGISKNPKKYKGWTVAQIYEDLYKKNNFEENINSPEYRATKSKFDERIVNMQETTKARLEETRMRRMWNKMSDEEKQAYLMAMQQQQVPQQYATGGAIYINPANKGKFTASANKAGMGVQEFAAHVLANKEDYSPLQVKRANFARNAKKFKHADGEPLTNRFSAPLPWEYNYSPNPTVEKNIQYPKVVNVTDPWQFTYNPLENDYSNGPIYKKVNPYFPNATETIDNKNVDTYTSSPLAYLRYAPITGSIIDNLNDAFGATNYPDYTNAERVERSVLAPRYIGYNPVGRYQRFDPIDTRYGVSQLGNQAAATNATIANLANANRATAIANILNQDIANRQGIAEYLLKSQGIDNTQRNAVIAANNALDEMNVRNQMTTDAANQAEYARYRNELANALLRGAMMREQADTTSEEARNANWQNLFTNIGNLGKEEEYKNMIQWLADKGVLKEMYKSKGGKLNHKKGK